MFSRVVEEFPRFFTYYNIVFFLQAMVTTFLLSAIGCVIGFAMGFFLVIARRTTGWWLFPARVLAMLFVEFFRRVPFLVTLLLVFFVFRSFNVDLSMFTVALLSVVFIATAYIGEIIRAGLDSVHHTQWDTADVMNFNLRQTLTLVIVPQAWKVILPPAFSFFIVFIKDTALASQIGVLELTYAAKVFNNKGFSAVLAFGTVLVLYFVLSYPLARFGRWMEGRLVSRDRRSESIVH
jgi:polar amino acid transport system permease protein